MAKILITMSNLDIKFQKAFMLVVLIKEYYEFNSTGGSLHILTDDGNYGKGFAQYCRDYAIENKDYWGELIATLLIEFDEEEQEQIVERPWEIIQKTYD